MRESYFILCSSVILTAVVCTDDKADIVKTGDSMPAFTLTSTVNGTVNSEDLKGKVVLINIFRHLVRSLPERTGRSSKNTLA